MKKFLKFIFKGMISNQEVLEGSKKQSYLSAVLVLLLSLIISVVPVFVSIAKQSGSSIVTSTQNASVDRSLVLFSKYISENDIKITINDDGILSVNGNLSADDANEYIVKAQDQELLAVRYCQDDEINSYSTMYSSGQLTLNGDVKETPRSYMLLTPHYVYIATYLNTATNTLTTNEETNTTTVKTFASTNASYSGLTKDAKGTDFTSFYSSSATETDVIASWKTVLNSMVKSTKTQSMWTYTGLILALNLGVTLLVSLLIFILTRLKSSTGDKLNYFQAFKVVCFAAFCPAILSLILGFVVSYFTQVGFILCLGLRSTFLGMRASNPEKYQNQQ